MEIINKSKFDIVCSTEDGVWDIYKSSDLPHPLNVYLKINVDLILIKKITEFYNKIIIKDSLIENEVEIEIIK